MLLKLILGKEDEGNGLDSSGRLERILTMVYVVQNSQNVSGLFPSSDIPKKNMF
jgi:hypothetical protein